MLYPETLVKAVKGTYTSNRVSKRVSNHQKNIIMLGLVFLKGKRWVGAAKLVNETVVTQPHDNLILGEEGSTCGWRDWLGQEVATIIKEWLKKASQSNNLAKRLLTGDK